VEQIYTDNGAAVTHTPVSGAASTIYGFFSGGRGDDYMGADAMHRRALFRCLAFGSYGVAVIGAGDTITYKGVVWEVLNGDRINDFLEWECEVNR